MDDNNWLDEVDWQYVIAQDPGGTTGVAVLRYTENTQPELVYLHQIEEGRKGFYEFFFGSWVGEGTSNVSVSEQWETREGVFGANLEPVHIEGIQYAIWADQTVYQSPKVKPMVGDEFLKANNLWTEGKRHQMDALLHAIYYLRSIGHEPTLKALAGESETPLAEPGEADEKTLDPDKVGDDDNATSIMATPAKFQPGDDDGGDEAGSGGLGASGYEDDETRPDGENKRTLNGAFMGFDDEDE